MTGIDRLTDGGDIVRHAFRQAQITGHEPFVQTASITRSAAPADLLPNDFVTERSATTDSSTVTFARSPRGSLLVSVLSRTTVVAASAADEALASSILSDVRARAPETTDHRTVPIRTWHLGQDGPRSSDRQISAPSLDEIAQNYPPQVRNDLDRLFAIERPTDGGKLILWHGDPGTGKTTAVRALLQHWRTWCAAQYVTDPERLFANPGYIGEVLTRSPMSRHASSPAHASDPGTLWRLIIAEDSDEYIRASARRDAGAGLGRLLNLADGILGQGFNTLILLTTNEELNLLHPALIRPGRCLAKVEFTRFAPAEARRWLPPGADPPHDPATLAELFERRATSTASGEPNMRRCRSVPTCDRPQERSLAELLRTSPRAEGQQVPWRPERWLSLPDGATPSRRQLANSPAVARLAERADTRGLLRKDVAAAAEDPLDLLITSMIWGFGPLGYGPLARRGCWPPMESTAS
jgi:hypothetical protein